MVSHSWHVIYAMSYGLVLSLCYQHWGLYVERFLMVALRFGVEKTIGLGFRVQVMEAKVVNLMCIGKSGSQA